ISSGGLLAWPSRPCEWPAKRLRGRPVSRTVTLRRARPSCKAPARPAKLPPMMMTSSMVMGSLLWMEGVGLGLARNIVQRYALETGSEKGFGIGEKDAHDCVDRPDDAAFDIAGRPGFGGMVETYPMACTFLKLYGIVIQDLGYCQGLELS